MGEEISLAIAIVSSENEQEWTYFLQNLQQAIPDFENVVTTIVHNRGEELQLAISTVFPACLSSDNVDTFLAPVAGSSTPLVLDPTCPLAKPRRRLRFSSKTVFPMARATLFKSSIDDSCWMDFTGSKHII
jgi:hypothetical protein